MAFFFKFPCFEFSCSFCSAEFPYLHDKRSRNIKKILFSTLLLYIPWSLYSTVLKCSFFQNDLARLEFIQSITIWFSKVNCLNVVILESSYNISVIICVKDIMSQISLFRNKRSILHDNLLKYFKKISCVLLSHFVKAKTIYFWWVIFFYLFTQFCHSSWSEKQFLAFSEFMKSSNFLTCFNSHIKSIDTFNNFSYAILWQYFVAVFSKYG